MADVYNRERTVIIEIGEVRPFSDIFGRTILRFDGGASSRNELVQRLKALGCVVDITGNDWLHEGEFTVDMELLPSLGAPGYTNLFGQWRVEVAGIPARGGEPNRLTGDAGEIITGGEWTIVTPDEKGRGFYGPYISLLPNRYRAIFRFKIDDNTGTDDRLANLDVSSRRARKRYAQRTLTVRDFTHSDKYQEFHLDFIVIYEDHDFEFRLRTDPNFARKQLTFDYVELRALG